jgi:hypothetical protein
MTPAQLTTFKAAILAEADPTLVAARQAGDEQAMATWYNGATSSIVWRSSTSADDLLNAIAWANLTPADTADGTATYTNRALACQAKQLNLQVLLQGRSSLATGKLNLRQGLSDALQNVPAGTGGTLLDAGWAGAGKVKATISRACTRAEKVFTTGTGTAAVPIDLGSFEGTVNAQTISDALNFGG